MTSPQESFSRTSDRFEHPRRRRERPGSLVFPSSASRTSELVCEDTTSRQGAVSTRVGMQVVSLAAASGITPRQMTDTFTRIATRGARAGGTAAAFGLAMLFIVGWLITGPVFGFSDTWQLVINTSTTIITFLMVFLIQNSQNRDSAAIQVKLDELIRVSTAQNSLVGIEHLTDEELENIRKTCES